MKNYILLYIIITFIHPLKEDDDQKALHFQKNKWNFNFFTYNERLYVTNEHADFSCIFSDDP